MKSNILCASVILAVLSTMPVAAKAKSKSAKPVIVATIYPQYDFARAVAGDDAEVSMLLKPGAEVHSYEPTPKDIKKMQKADLFIYTGGENDVWIEKMLSNNGKMPRTLKLLDLVDTVEEELVEGMTEEEEEHEHEHGHDEDEEEEVEIDEHVWTSPLNAIKITQAICDELCAIDGAHAAAYKKNVSAYIAQLQNLHEQFASIVKNAKRKVFVFGDRFPLRYFADAYGLSYYAAFPGCATDVEASAATIKFLINKVKQEKIPVVFTIEFSNGKIADTICEATGAKKMEFHCCHNVSADDLKKGETYVSIMTRNVSALKAALN